MNSFARVWLGAIVAMLIVHGAVAGPLEDGVTAYGRGDFAGAMRLLAPIADQGNPVAQQVVGAMYLNGQGVRQDFAQALNWTQKAADQKNADAQYDLGRMYNSGAGVRQDPAQAMTWFRRAADQGHAGGQYNVGVLFNDGRGARQDYAEAMNWYRRAADQGHTRSQFAVGTMHSQGHGVPVNHAEAANWYRRAAEGGYAPAQGNLGQQYFDGVGVPQDYVAAARWFFAAAEQGDIGTQFNIGRMYFLGLGVLKDNTRAYMWFELVAASKAPEAQQLRDLAVRFRDIVRPAMIPQAIAEAQALARDWKPGMETQRGMAVPLPFAERAVVPMPGQDWKADPSGNRIRTALVDNSYTANSPTRTGVMTVQYIPPARTGDPVAETLSVQTLYGNTRPPTEYLATLQLLYTQSPPCDKTNVTSAPAQVDGREALFATITCTKSKVGGLGSVTLVLLMPGKDALYVIQRNWTGPAFAEDRPPVSANDLRAWQEHLARVTLCDSRVPQRACPAV